MDQEMDWEEYEKILIRRSGFKEALEETRFEYEIARLAVAQKTKDIISDISFDDDHIIVSLINGVQIFTPLKYFPRLTNVNPEQRNRWELIGRGIGIHWEDIDEDISLETLIKYGTINQF